MSAADPNAVYALGRSSAESERLQRQADELAPESAELLDRVPLRAGDSAIDVGCGPRGVVDLLSERVSPDGRVVGLDANPAHVAMAAEFAARSGLRDVEFVCADARDTGIESDSFDLVHARALLINLPEPPEVLTELVRLARPGGRVVGLEPDVGAAVCYPPLPALDRLTEIFGLAFTRNGADPQLGRRLGELYRGAGLVDVGLDARARAYPVGHSRRTLRPDLVRAVRPEIVDLGIADERELDELDAAVRRHFDDPATVVIPSLVFLAWGRKPVT